MTLSADQDTPAATSPAPAPPPTPGGPRRIVLRVAAAVFVVFLASAFALQLAGVGSGGSENRSLAPPPPAGELLALDGDALEEFRAYLDDRAPVRDPGVRLDAWVDRTVFGDTPNPAVVLGERGWLFLAASAEAACLGDDGIDRLRDDIALADRIVTATGREFAFLLPPDKIAMYPDRVGEAAERVACALANAGGIRERIEDDPPAGYLPVWRDLEQAVADAGDPPLYFQQDTHWRSRGAATFARSLVDGLRPGLFETGTLEVARTSQRTGDLSRLIGLPDQAPEDEYVVTRPGVSWQLLDPRDRSDPTDVGTRTTATGDVIDGRTLFLHDSFGWSVLPVLPSFFADLTTWRTPSPQLSEVAPLVRDADRIVIEMVQRRVSSELVAAELPGQLAAVLADDLPTAPVPLDDGRPAAVDVVGARFLSVVVPDVAGAAAVELGGEQTSEGPSAEKEVDDPTLVLYVVDDDGGERLVDLRPNVFDGRAVFDLETLGPQSNAVRFEIRNVGGQALGVSEATLIGVPGS